MPSLPSSNVSNTNPSSAASTPTSTVSNTNSVVAIGAGPTSGGAILVQNDQNMSTSGYISSSTNSLKSSANNNSAKTTETIGSDTKFRRELGSFSDAENGNLFLCSFV